MSRLFAFLVLAVCISTRVGSAGDELTRWTVVVSDHDTASMLPKLPWGSRISVLMPKKSESDAAIHSRALRLCSATHFIYCGGGESTILAMYRERFRNQGAVVVDVRTLPREKLIALFPLPEDDSAVRLVATQSLSMINELAE